LFGPADFITLLVDLDITDGANIGALDGPLKAAVIGFICIDVHATLAANQAGVGSTNLNHWNVCVVFVNIKGNGKGDPFIAGFLGIHDFSQDRLADVGTQGIGGTGEQFNVGVAKGQCGHV